jgi:hypothetical protein
MEELKNYIKEYIENNIIITMLVATFVGCLTGFSAFGYPLSGVVVGLCSVLLGYCAILMFEKEVRRIESTLDDQTEAIVDALEMDILDFERKFLEGDDEAHPPHQR